MRCSAGWTRSIAAREGTPRDDVDARIAANKRDFDARFEPRALLIAQQRWTEAMDELLEILMRDKSLERRLARKTYIAILQLMTKSAPAPKAEAADKKGALEVAGKIVAAPADPVVDSYRRKLSMTLFERGALDVPPRPRRRARHCCLS